ncbi:MAG: hypothetical protein LBM98_03035 [Oscillospiraceae bacterium]|nr:hypothetical protein [Oscillospiraceae bacterium]
MLRTCNVLRIAGLAVLRNDGQGFALPPRARRGGGASLIREFGRGLRNPGKACLAPTHYFKSIGRV